jgi:hypothetical protein
VGPRLREELIGRLCHFNDMVTVTWHFLWNGASAVPLSRKSQPQFDCEDTRDTYKESLDGSELDPAQGLIKRCLPSPSAHTGDTASPYRGGLLGSTAQQRAESPGQCANFRSD